MKQLIELEQIKSTFETLFSAQDRMLFASIVAAPVFLTFLYLYLFIPNKYISESKLSIHDSNIPVVTDSFLSSLGLSSGQDQNDNRLIQAHLKSPLLADKADHILSLRNHYSDSFDFLFGLPGNASREDYLKFYLKHISVDIDAESGLLVIRTQAFDPETALSLNELLLSEGELFINGLNNKVAESEMAFAKEEMARNLKILHEAQLSLTDFQQKKSLTSPNVEAESITAILFQLETSIAETKALLGETLTYLSPDSAQAKSLSAKIESLENQVVQQKARVTGTQEGIEGISEIGIEYQDLLFEVELARTVYETAVGSFEVARNQSAKKLKHLLIAESPVLSEDSKTPNRPYWLLTFSFLYLALFGIIRMILRSISEHRE